MLPMLRAVCASASAAMTSLIFREKPLALPSKIPAAMFGRYNLNNRSFGRTPYTLHICTSFGSTPAIAAEKDE